MPDTSRPHVTIIGAGIIGMSCALFLQREGCRVTLIDRVPPGEGCSYGNAGGVVVSSVMPPVHPRMLAKIPGWLLDPLGPLTIRWRRLPRALPWLMAVARNALPGRVRHICEARALLGMMALADHRTVLRHAGAGDLLAMDDGLHIYASRAQYDGEAGWRAQRAAYGYCGRELSADEAREVEPDLTRDIYRAMFWDGWHRIRDPYRMVQKLAERAVRDGAEIVRDEVVRITHDAHRATALDLRHGGERKLDALCVAAGAWSGELARMLGDRVLLEAERGYHLIMDDAGIRLGRAVTHAAQPGTVTPHHDGIKIAGSDEIAGNDAPPDWRRARQMHVYGKRLFPGLRPLDGSEAKWMGRRPSTPDSLPVISASPKLENVWYGFGHGHMGLSWGPSTGRLVAALVAGTPVNTDISAFRIDRAM